MLQEHFACIVGEPGIGKTRLVEEIRKLTSTKHVYYTASKFDTNTENVSADKEYCIIDALDEVDGSLFYRVLLSIGQYKMSIQMLKCCLLAENTMLHLMQVILLLAII